MVNPQEDLAGEQRPAAALRSALGREEAPECWVKDALGVPARLRRQEAELRRRDTLLVSLLPHMIGAAMAPGIGVAALFAPGWLREEALFTGRFNGLRAFLTPLLPLLLADGARGFAVIRRWLS